MRKRTSKPRRYRHHVKVLKSEVMTPRIAWFNFLAFLKTLTKVAVVVALLLGVAYGVRQAIEHSFHKNPDFNLQVIDLNENDVLDEADLVDYLSIDLASNIFDFDVEHLEQQLLLIPAISMAEVKRNLPGTLEIRVKTRRPAAWIACPDEGYPAQRRHDALLVDQDGFTYPCPPGQVEGCKELPILLLSTMSEHHITPGKILDHPQYKHCLHLLKAVVTRDRADLAMIETISQKNKWSLLLVTRGGTAATFGLGNHDRQLDYFEQALNHAQKKGYGIETINLIPKRNIPITVSGDAEPPRAIPVPEPETVNLPESRREHDLRTLLNRN
ncbi:MAG: FtsQ-type POTRA domain-containing protein [Luteolibacter sp.]